MKYNMRNSRFLRGNASLTFDEMAKEIAMKMLTNRYINIAQVYDRARDEDIALINCSNKKEHIWNTHILYDCKWDIGRPLYLDEVLQLYYRAEEILKEKNLHHNCRLNLKLFNLCFL